MVWSGFHATKSFLSAKCAQVLPKTILPAAASIEQLKRQVDQTAQKHGFRCHSVSWEDCHVDEEWWRRLLRERIARAVNGAESQTLSDVVSCLGNSETHYHVDQSFRRFGAECG